MLQEKVKTELDSEGLHNKIETKSDGKIETSPESKIELNLEMQNIIATINQNLLSNLHSKLPIINHISSYIINAGGKRLRGLIVVVCGKILKDIILEYKVENDLLPLFTYRQEQLNLADYIEKISYDMATMIELIHVATLLHDDVVDRSELRRGIKTANLLFGNSSAVLVGDFLYTKAFQIIGQSKSLSAIAYMADITNRIAEGEVLQLINTNNLDITQNEYLNIIEQKTSILFEASTRIMFLILYDRLVCNNQAHGSSIEVLDCSFNSQSNIAKIHQLEECFCKYASSLGVMFQLIDDISDYTGTEETNGKKIGDDIRDGKITLPLICLMTQNPSIKTLLNQIIEYKNGSIQQNKDIFVEQSTQAQEQYQQAIEQIINIVKTSDSMNQCMNIVQMYAKVIDHTISDAEQIYPNVNTVLSLQIFRLIQQKSLSKIDYATIT